jgi:hypothetical protein
MVLQGAVTAHHIISRLGKHRHISMRSIRVDLILPIELLALLIV